MWQRIVAAAKVLRGVRPAEVQFDRLDRWIASECACVATDKILGRFFSETDPPLRDDIFAEALSPLIYEAIRHYATHEAVEGPWCRKEFEDIDRTRKEGLRKQKLAQAASADDDIPF